MPEGFAPDSAALRLDVGSVVKQDQSAGRFGIAVQGHRIDIHHHLTDALIRTCAAVLLFGLRKYVWRRFQGGVELRTHGQFFAVVVIDGDANQMFPVSEAIHNSAKLAGGAPLQNRLHGFLKAFREDFRASFKIRLQSPFF